jgi:hypothetical protein
MQVCDGHSNAEGVRIQGQGPFVVLKSAAQIPLPFRQAPEQILIVRRSFLPPAADRTGARLVAARRYFLWLDSDGRGGGDE